MLVYQVLKCLTDSARVHAVLDASHHRADSDSRSGSSVDGDEAPLASTSYLTTQLLTPLLHGDDDVDPGSIRYSQASKPKGDVDPGSVRYSEAEAESEEPKQAFFPRRVIWLSGPPESFKELAVAYLTVCQKFNSR